jgi:hypothetical protein
MSFVHQRLGALALASSCLLFAGCSSDDTGGGGAGGSSGSSGASGSGASAGSAGSGGGSATGGSGGQECPSPGNHAVDVPQQIDALNGRIVDLDGNSVGADMQATVCGTDLCIYGKTDDQGVVLGYNEVLDAYVPGIEPKLVINNPAFKFAQGFNYVKWAYALPPGAVHDVGEFPTARFPDISTGVEIVEGGDASSSGVILSVPAGAGILHDNLDYELPEQLRFRAVEIPIAKAPPAVDPALGFEIVIGTTPVDTYFCQKHAKLSVPNSAGWAAGTEVQFFAHGVDPLGEWVPYREWGKVSGGAVSSDGKSVVTHDGEGVPFLTVFGIRKKQ